MPRPNSLSCAYLEEQNMKLTTLRPILVFLAVASLASSVQPAQAALRVCGDPDYLPYSNRAGAGRENKIPYAVAEALGEPLEYTWENTRPHGGLAEFLP